VYGERPPLRFDSYNTFEADHPFMVQRISSQVFHSDGSCLGLRSVSTTLTEWKTRVMVLMESSGT
jgi:hypothetical protein